MMMLMMLVNPPSLSLFAEVSSERSPRRRSISGLGSSEKSVAVDNPNTSPFKVPVSNGNASLCMFLFTARHHREISGPSLLCRPLWCSSTLRARRCVACLLYITHRLYIRRSSCYQQVALKPEYLILISYVCLGRGIAHQRLVSFSQPEGRVAC